MHPSTSAGALSFRFPAHDLRVVWREREPWFVAADVCAALDIQNPSQALQRLDEDEHSLCSAEGVHSGAGNPNVSIINESGLYSLILGSRKPEAKRFKRWVTSEVLPSLRRSGRYELAAPPPTPGSQLTAQPNQAALALATPAVAAILAKLQDQLIKAQASQLRLHQRLASSDKRGQRREAWHTVLEMKRKGFDQNAIEAATGINTNHIRQIVFKARKSGLLPPAPAMPPSQSPDPAQASLPLEAGHG